jgi:DNA-binding PadR family transcriptional regulator
MMNEKRTKDFEKLKQEMRRGVIVLAVLSQLKQEQYGYSLIKNLEEKDFKVGQDTLYPLLRRLEQQGLLDSEWRVDDPRPRRYYILNETGKEMLKDLKAEWRAQEETVRRLLDETE